MWEPLLLISLSLFVGQLSFFDGHWRGFCNFEVHKDDHIFVLLINIRDTNFMTHLECVPDVVCLPNDDDMTAYLSQLTLLILCI